ncbi:RloB domain-containing protein [Sporomusa termitida]|uniref:Uncharacterized protein n=1 Tax=Sporomusa termitida TaxID=2377 RepID=A0A517DQC1_9FIRM|nr:RloB domain-containing protein [Sporomusa termitida]QDR79508.1 hypothetical protein SPTER_07830 [Sporomusa termitida]
MSKKAVNALGREKRRMHTIEPLTYYLIICEGTKTEPEYFKEIRSLINAQYDHRVEVRQVEIQIEGEATNTVFLLERAKNMLLS